MRNHPDAEVLLSVLGLDGLADGAPSPARARSVRLRLRLEVRPWREPRIFLPPIERSGVQRVSKNSSTAAAKPSTSASPSGSESAMKPRRPYEKPRSSMCR